MRALIAAACLAGVIWGAGCSSPCLAPEDCDPGMRCDPISGACVAGCEKGEDCPSGQCNTEERSCVPIELPLPDASIEDASTSTRTDAG